jgi:kynureninase
VRFPKAGLELELAKVGAVVDLRPPDIVRITPAPLYNSFEDVHRFCARIAEARDG